MSIHFELLINNFRQRLWRLTPKDYIIQMIIAAFQLMKCTSSKKTISVYAGMLQGFLQKLIYIINTFKSLLSEHHVISCIGMSIEKPSIYLNSANIENLVNLIRSNKLGIIIFLLILLSFIINGILSDINISQSIWLFPFITEDILKLDIVQSIRQCFVTKTLPKL